MNKNWVIHVVDDDEPVRTALEFALTAAKFDVIVHASVADFPTTEVIDHGLLICDVRMPLMSGIELTRALRQAGSTMPIILLTGHASPALQLDAMAAGAGAILSKPVSLFVLLAEIARLTAGPS